MRTTIDKAGRVVVPASIRERLGMLPGPVELTIDGTGVRIEAVAADRLVEEDDLLVIEGSGPSVSADDIRELRLADQR